MAGTVAFAISAASVAGVEDSDIDALELGIALLGEGLD